MNEVLKMLLEGESLSTEQMAKILAREPAAIEADLAKLKADNILLGWRPVLHPNAAGENQVRALIEVKVTPEREGGFDRLAERVSRFEEAFAGAVGAAHAVAVTSGTAGGVSSAGGGLEGRRADMTGTVVPEGRRDKRSDRPLSASAYTRS